MESASPAGIGPVVSSDRGALRLRFLADIELASALTLLADGMADNPLHRAVFGNGFERRRRGLRRFMTVVLAHVQRHGAVLGAFAGDELIGVLGMLPPGRCRPGVWVRLRMGLRLLSGVSPGRLWRIRRWLRIWRRLDPATAHWHLGPLVVAPAWRRRGVGRALMAQCCERLDAAGAEAWLETDLAINVAFYRLLGFELEHGQRVLGVDNWFMWRRSRS